MRGFISVRAIGISVGLALFVAIGMVALMGSNPSPDRVQPGPIEANLATPAEQLGKSFAMVAAHVKPCVVSVYSEKAIKFTSPDFSFPFGDNFFHRFFGDNNQPSQPHDNNQLPRPHDNNQPSRPHEYRGFQRGMGSGMLLDKQGHVLTNYHVVSDVTELKVQLPDKRTFEAEITGSDPKTDVAVIRIKGQVPADLPSIELGDSDALQPGYLVLAIGAPFGLTQTVTNGIISATGRSDVGVAGYEDFLQTDAPINPGNSGGPLVNMRGEVIGMTSAIATSVGQFGGVGFAIPSNMIKNMLPKLLKGEKIVRGQLGVVIQEMTGDLASHFGLPEPKGVLVAQVNTDSPGEKAGLKAGDIITRYDGKETNDVHHLRDLVAATAPGASVKIDILRKGKPETLTATIGEQEALAAGNKPAAEEPKTLEKFGLGVQTLSPDMAKQLGVEVAKGAVINEVDEGSLASLAGLQKGDVITEADHQPVGSAEDLKQILAKAKDKESLLLHVVRKGGSLYVVLQSK